MEAGVILQHYKGGKYRVLFAGTHSETLEDVIIYQNTADQRVWVRPLQMFYDMVEYKGEEVPRFKILEGG